MGNRGIKFLAHKFGLIVSRYSPYVLFFLVSMREIGFLLLYFPISKDLVCKRIYYQSLPAVVASVIVLYQDLPYLVEDSTFIFLGDVLEYQIIVFTQHAGPSSYKDQRGSPDCVLSSLLQST